MVHRLENEKLIKHIESDTYVSIDECAKCGGINIEPKESERYYKGKSIVDTSVLECMDCGAKCKDVQTWE